MTEENKQLNKAQELQNTSGPFSISDVSIFNNNRQFVYLHQKTEKLISAIYLLSNFISDKEPIKWQLRDAGVDLLSQCLSLSDRTSSDHKIAYSNFISTVIRLMSILEVAHIASIVSEMNYKILKNEFEGLIKTIESIEGEGSAKGLIFPEHFFAVSENQVNQNLNTQKINAPVQMTDKGQDIMSDRMSLKKVVNTVKNVEQKKEIKSNRQEIIIGLLKKNAELGIKDFVSSIKDCGEKTIQRELVSLVSKGLIKKEGEKRWSRYSLK